ncbi:tetratricopeptide repeat protein [Candidatus Woesebacteria bacterium]|nr:tetratricopeptide repeat protein [Candidatus Woesebacteria bacterium]
MNDDLSKKAVNAALCGNWQDAIIFNKKILDNSPGDTDALNRLARAYVETGDINKAKKTAKKVTSIDPFNKIAIKSLEKWRSLKNGSKTIQKTLQAQTYLEEPGKTKIVNLINLGKEDTISVLDCGDELNLDAHGHNVNLSTLDGNYVGRLPDDLSARLRKLIKLGNTYIAFVKNSDKNSVKVFLKEVERADKVKDIPSFSSEKIDYVSFTPPELVHGEKPQITDDEE